MILIDEVYQRVLLIANKENRGFITPSEFNAAAKQAQDEIFEDYFGMEERLELTRGGDTSSDYGDMSQNIREKISQFDASATVTGSTTTNIFSSSGATNFYRLINLYTSTTPSIEIQEETHKRLPYLLNSQHNQPTARRPIYVKTGNTTTGAPEFEVYPTSLASINVIYTRAPKFPMWVGDTTTSTAVPATSDSDYQNFELHPSERKDLVAKILTYSGVIIRDQELTQSAASKESQLEQKKQ